MFCGKSFRGVSMEKPYACDRARNCICDMCPASQPFTLIAPSLRDLFQSVTSKLTSISLRKPSPPHSGHAPYGLLKEKSLGVNSSKDNSQSGQAYFVEYNTSSPSKSAITSPSESLIAFSIASEIRLCAPSLTTIRSMTTLMVCLMFLSSAISSSSV